MDLTLEVTGPQAAALGPGSRHVFSSAGGVIGRAKTSDWVLPHAKVSGRHAVISYLDGVFYIEDTSSNGVFMNSPHNRLVSGRRYALEAGDRILIDPYEIDVSVSSARDTPRAGMDDYRDARSADRGYAAANPFDIEDSFASGPPPRPTPRSTPSRASAEPEPVPADEVDPLKLLGGGPKPTPARKAPTAEDLDLQPAVAGHYKPPPVPTPTPAPPPLPTQSADPFVIPAGYDPLLDDFTGPAPPVPEAPPSAAAPSEPIDIPSSIDYPPPTPPPERPTPPPKPAPPVVLVPEPVAVPPHVEEPSVLAPPMQGTAGLTALLDGAGLENVVPTPELARSIGEIFRVVVAGVMDVLRSRQQVKDEFRMRMTQFRPADNNPLKFSANVDDALHNLLVKRNPAYLGPVDAFEDAFDDLRNHQLAVLAGMRVAFEAMLAEFDPDRLEKEFDRQLKRTPLAGAIARLRYWDLYRDRREGMTKDPDATFKRLFGEVFARAYEEQLNRLKAESRAREAGDGEQGAVPSPRR